MDSPTHILNRSAMEIKTAISASRYVRTVVLAFLAGTFLLAPCRAQVYGTANHTVTVVVQPVTTLRVNIGTANLNISGANAVAGVDAMTVTDQSTTLLWGTNSSLRKITVSTSLGTPLFTLKVLAVNPTVGTASPEVTLSTLSADFMLNIGRSSGSCSLRYTGIALASQGTGTDAHTITFTVQAQ